MNKEIFEKEITLEEKIIYYYSIYKEEQNETKKDIIFTKLKDLLAEYNQWMN